MNISTQAFKDLVTARVDHILDRTIETVILNTFGLTIEYQSIMVAVFGPRENTSIITNELLERYPDFFETLFRRYFSRIEDPRRITVIESDIVDDAVKNFKWDVKDRVRKFVRENAILNARNDFELIKQAADEWCKLPVDEAKKAIAAAVKKEMMARKAASRHARTIVDPFSDEDGREI